MAVQRFLLFQRRDLNVYPTNETVAQVFARLSAFRDALDGPQVSLHAFRLLLKHIKL